MALIERLPRTGEYLFSINGRASRSSRCRCARRCIVTAATASPFTDSASAFRDWGGEQTNAPRELLEVALAHAIGGKTERAMRAAICWRSGAG